MFHYIIRVRGTWATLSCCCWSFYWKAGRPNYCKHQSYNYAEIWLDDRIFSAFWLVVKFTMLCLEYLTVTTALSRVQINYRRILQLNQNRGLLMGQVYKFIKVHHFETLSTAGLYGKYFSMWMSLMN